MNPKRSLGRNIFFSVIIFCVFFLGIEIIARVYLYFSAGDQRYTVPTLEDATVVSDMVLNHKWRPSMAVQLSARGTSYDLTTNREGWLETYEVSKEKPDNTYRIFYLGDSTTQGVVAREHSMVSLVEARLNAHYGGRPRIEVINTGTSSYSTLLYYLLVRHKIRHYSPDLVVINVDMTDVINDSLYRKRLVLDEQGLPLAVRPFELADKQRFRMTPEGVIEISPADDWNRFLYGHVAFYRVMTVAVLKLTHEVPRVKRLEGWLPWGGKSDSSANWLALEWTAAVQEHIDFSTDILRKTVALLKQHDIRVMISSVPHYPQYTGEWSRRPHDILSEVTATVGALYLNGYAALETAIAGSEVSRYYWRSDPTHFNEAGNAAWAQAQYEFLMANRNALLP